MNARSKTTLLAALVFFTLAFAPIPRPSGTWHAGMVVLNGDTLFLASDSTRSITHAFRLHAGLSLAKDDSAEVRRKGMASYWKERSTLIRFYNDSDVVMTKVRSGGRGNVNELDSGVFTMRNDTVVFTLRTRRNYQFGLVYDPKAELLHITDGLAEHRVYMTYTRTE
ncbi:MAG TPA: hypothetical protein VHL57_09025 [Flavobacteriales bacterium]|nr:hypothetical protein [Flavobacteriales bacterium]